jgi:glycosyltransferase involved in cell wall biosynthesis
LRIINIVDSVSDLNLGVWLSSIVNAELLGKKGINVEIWHPDNAVTDFNDAVGIKIRDSSIRTLKQLIADRKLTPDADIVVTHGLWKYPTRWGHYLKKSGFQWVFVPQGMLEPWPLRQKWLKKKIYFAIVEKHLAKKADIIRAVSKPEARNLANMFRSTRIEFIPNGVNVADSDLNQNSTIQRLVESESLTNSHEIKRYLFLSRLHHKKNIIALAEAWVDSRLNNNTKFEFIIAGPDQGELEELNPIIVSSSNITYLGAIFGSEKESVLNSCIFYILPSFSEGLPTALLEAMAHGLIPIITEGCNFPDVFEKELGIKVTTEKNSIKQALENTASWDVDTIREKSERGRALIVEEYSLEAITKKQIEIYFGASL